MQPLEVMRQFTAKRGLLEELSGKVSVLEKVVFDARLPRHQAKITNFLVEIE